MVNPSTGPTRGAKRFRCATETYTYSASTPVNIVHTPTTVVIDTVATTYEPRIGGLEGHIPRTEDIRKSVAPFAERPANDLLNMSDAFNRVSKTHSVSIRTTETDTEGAFSKPRIV